MHNDGLPEELQDMQVLVVDDQEDVCRGLQRLIQGLGCLVHTAYSGQGALNAMKRDAFDLILTDLKMEGMSGVELLQTIKNKWPETEVVLISGHGTIEIAVQALQQGAAHFITKPFDNDEVIDTVKRMAFNIFSRRNERRFEGLGQPPSMIAVDQKMKDVLALVKRVAPSDAPVLIEGASGTGKELIAREIHRYSKRRDAPFVAINCIALPDTLLESELFGYRKGAFTGANRDATGLFEQADGGTVFLDEIASMSPLFQGKLLRVLQEKTVRPLGGDRDVPVNFRLLAASNKNLISQVKEGRFREDLFYRLQVVRMELPPLKERKNGIPVMAEHFLNRAAESFLPSEAKKPVLTSAVLDTLLQYDWPGNVRELENTIQRAVIISNGAAIQPEHLGLPGQNMQAQSTGPPRSYEEGKKQAIRSFQEQYLEDILARTGGNISRAAELCGLTRAALQRIMRKLQIDRRTTANQIF